MNYSSYSDFVHIHLNILFSRRLPQQYAQLYYFFVPNCRALYVYIYIYIFAKTLKTLKTVVSFSLMLTNQDILDQQATSIEMVDFDRNEDHEITKNITNFFNIILGYRFSAYVEENILDQFLYSFFSCKKIIFGISVFFITNFASKKSPKNGSYLVESLWDEK